MSEICKWVPSIALVTRGKYIKLEGRSDNSALIDQKVDQSLKIRQLPQLKLISSNLRQFDFVQSVMSRLAIAVILVVLEIVVIF